MYCSPAFLQFMKEGNVVLVFALSCVVGLQVCTRSRFVNIVWILAGASMAVSGQVHFVLAGFLFQLISQFSECGKNVMGDWMMKSHLKLDALTYTMFLSPMCLIVLMVGAAVTWKAEILTDFASWWMFIIPNGCLAFTMNVTVSLLIKECSAIAFILTGFVKDAVIVICGAALLGETVTSQQYLGFFVCLSGVFFWSYSRIDPHAPLVKLFQKLTFSEVESEKAPLLPKSEKVKEAS
jgi:drug/metabolite transporter (DMT)-like permease